MSQHAYALELLSSQLKEGNKALDVGSGSGYLTSCFAHMVNRCCCIYILQFSNVTVLQLGSSGKALGIDHIPELVKFAEDNVRNDSPELMDENRIQFLGKIFIFF